MSGKTFKNPLNQDERNMMLELSSLTAKHKAFNPYQRRLIYSIGKHSNLYKFLLEKIPGLVIALTEWCEEKKLNKFYKKSKAVLEKFERLGKKLKPEGLKKLSIKQIIKKADKLKEEANDDSDIKAFELYLEAAEKGDGYAQNTIGDYFYYGTCYKWNHKYKKPEPDFYKAVSWYEKSIQNEYPEAFASLGYCFTRGDGVEKSTEKGVELLEKAHELGEDWILEHLIQNLAFIVIAKIHYGEDERSEKIKLQKYIHSSKKHLYDSLQYISTIYDEVSEVEVYKEFCLKLSKTLAISAFMEGDSEVNKKESKKFLKKSGYENDQEEVEHVENNLEFSEVIFSSNADSFSENKSSSKKKVSKEQKKIIPFPNTVSIQKHKLLEGFRSLIDEEEEWIKSGESTHQEFKNRIFFKYDEKEAKNYSKEQYKSKVQCATAIEIAKKMCGFLNNTSTINQVIRLGITNDSKPNGIVEDIKFFKRNNEDDLKTKEKIKQSLLDHLSRLLPRYHLIECDYKKFQGTTYLNLVIKNKFKKPGTYIYPDQKIFNSANLKEKKNKFDSKYWVKDFFIRKGEDTVILPPEDVKTHIEELEFRFDEDLN